MSTPDVQPWYVSRQTRWEYVTTMTKEKEPTAEDKVRGGRLADLRSSRGWSQAEVARRAGFANPDASGRQRVVRLESGFLKFTSPEQQRGYAQAFGTTVGAILEYARGERTLADLVKNGSASQPRPKTDPSTPARRAEPDRWREFGRTYPTFMAQATMALEAKVVTAAMLDAASDELTAKGSPPTSDESRLAILAARDGVTAWAELLSRNPGTTPAHDPRGSKGKVTRK